MASEILTSVENRILKITFNRPTKKNAITAAMYGTMADAMAKAQKDDAIRAILFTANGDAFTAGNDLIDFRDNPPLTADAPVSRFLHELVAAEKPLVAAVNGIAVGVGLTMLLHCDLVYMAEGAQLQAPFVDLALVPEAGSSLLLPQRVGHARAAEMFMLGKRVSATEAKSMGLVNDVCAVDTLLPTAEKAALALTKKAPEALRQTKRLMRGDLSVVSERMIEESKVFGTQLQSPELLEAVMAFMQKRAPDFG